VIGGSLQLNIEVLVSPLVSISRIQVAPGLSSGIFPRQWNGGGGNRVLLLFMSFAIYKIYNWEAQVVIHARTNINGNDYDGKFKLLTKM
jgi:hypothetical protein